MCLWRVLLGADTGHLQGFLSPWGREFSIAKNHLDCFECRGSPNGMQAWVHTLQVMLLCWLLCWFPKSTPH